MSSIQPMRVTKSLSTNCHYLPSTTSTTVTCMTIIINESQIQHANCSQKYISSILLPSKPKIKRFNYTEIVALSRVYQKFRLPICIRPVKYQTEWNQGKWTSHIQDSILPDGGGTVHWTKVSNLFSFFSNYQLDLNLVMIHFLNSWFFLRITPLFKLFLFFFF